VVKLHWVNQLRVVWVEEYENILGGVKDEEKFVVIEEHLVQCQVDLFKLYAKQVHVTLLLLMN
jgi:hypothetical protein